jgi:hypothetical protein
MHKRRAEKTHRGSKTLRQRIRTVRQATIFVIFLVVSAWGYLNHRAETFVFAWTEPLRVLVVPLIDPATDPDSDATTLYLHDFLSTTAKPGSNLRGMEEWLQAQFRHYSPGSGKAVELTIEPAVGVETPPPLLPDESDSLLSRWLKTSSFISYFERLDKDRELLRSAYDTTIFLYFYSHHRLSTFADHHSVATRRDQFGVVFVPLEVRSRGFYAALVAHELCHTFGATDKYEGERSVYPQGYAEPSKVPRYPQSHAEIMALGIPVAPDVELRVDHLGACRVGKKTAEEMGWR